VRATPIQGAAGLKVLELSAGLAGAYAGLILRAQGAEVTLSSAGLKRDLDEFERAYYDRGKALAERDWRTLRDEADVVVCDFPLACLRELALPLTLDELQAGAVAVYITPFGLMGPHSSFASTDITEWAAGGLAYVSRRGVPESDGPGYSPVLAPGRQPEVLAGIAGASAALFGCLHAEMTGEAVIADVSRQEVQAAMLHGVVPPFVWNSVVPGAPASRVSIGMLVPAADGLFYLRPVEAHHWDALYRWMGNPDWTAEPWASDSMSRQQQMPLITELVGLWAAQFPRQKLLVDGQAHHVPVALPRSIDDVLESGHLRERDFWQPVTVGGKEALGPAIPMLDPCSWSCAPVAGVAAAVGGA